MTLMRIMTTDGVAFASTMEARFLLLAIRSAQPAADFHGTETITYTLTDGNGGTGMGTGTVTADPVNDACVCGRCADGV